MQTVKSDDNERMGGLDDGVRFGPRGDLGGTSAGPRLWHVRLGAGPIDGLSSPDAISSLYRGNALYAGSTTRPRDFGRLERPGTRHLGRLMSSTGTSIVSLVYFHVRMVQISFVYITAAPHARSHIYFDNKPNKQSSRFHVPINAKKVPSCMYRP